VDWVYFSATQGVTYTIWTLNLAGATDTFIDLWTADGQFITSNDDDPGHDGRASRITWRAPATGTYFVRVYDYSPALHYCCSTGYDLEIFVGEPAPAATATATRTPTGTPTRTATGTSTGTATGTVTPTGTGTRTSTATALATKTNTPTSTFTPSQTRTPTATGTRTITPTRTPTPTNTPMGDNVYCNTTVTGDSRGRRNNFVNYNCGGGSETGPEMVYQLATDVVTTITARILSYEPEGIGNPDIFILTNYSNTACVNGGYADGSSPLNVATYTDAPPGLTYIVVDGWQGWAERFTLQVSCSGLASPTPTATSTVPPTHPTWLFLPVILGQYE